jgi:hypothetical protein
MPLRLEKATRKQVAQQTDGFSFAYLKELFLSSALARAGAPDGARMDAIMLEQVQALRAQMRTGGPM